MKKNIAMRVAAFLFILTMISTCAFATTFAKYTTSDTATDEARVAKWGVTVSMVGMDQTEYEYGGTAQDTSISATTTEKNIAPGSEIRFATINLTGTPEVAVSVTYTATLDLSNWVVGGTEYCPLVFKVGSVDYFIGKDVSGSTIEAVKALGKIESISELKTAVEAAIVAYSKNYDANTNLVNQTANQLTVHCSWAFSSSDADDIKDTALGNAATDADTSKHPGISLTITCTVTQID